MQGLTVGATAAGIAAAQVMAQRPDDADTALLIRLARDADPSVKAQALSTLGAVGSREAIDSLLSTATGAALGLPLRLRQIPQAVTVITSQNMEDQNLTSLDSVLQSAAGVTRNFIDSERVNYSSRGFAVDNIMYDGVVSSLDNGIGFIDTALYDRVEVVRGATGLLTGAGNPSASINLIRKRPKNDFAIGASALAGPKRPRE